MRPNIGAVVRNIDRNVAHDADAVTTAAISYLFPLAKEFELGKAVIRQLGRQFPPPFLENSRIPSTDSRIPMNPRLEIVNFLAGHEERIVLQPLRVLLAKIVEGAAVGVSAVSKKGRRGLL